MPGERRDYDVVTFGETMLRLSAPGYSRLEEATSLDVRIGGSESNTAVALRRLGLRVNWWSRLPANPLGRRIENEIRRWGVDTSGTIWEDRPEARAGLYFLDFGTAPRGIDVHYDRANASITRIRLHDIDIERLSRSHLLHLTGITPALSESCAEAVRFLMAQAKVTDTLVSFDLNYRARLWTPEKARKCLESLLPLVDILICPQADASTVFGMKGTGPALAQEFRDHYSLKAAVITCGGDGAYASDSLGDWSASCLPLPQVVDRVGAGDAFNAGVLMGYLDGNLALGLEYGMAMSALKHTIPGDLLLSTREEIETAMEGGNVGIRR